MRRPTAKSAKFRSEREGGWFELEAIVDVIEKRGIAGATAEQLSRLPLLYRSALSSLSVARTISLDRNLIDYLEALCSRAYFCVYTTRRRPWELVVDFITRGFPLAVWQLRRHLALATLTLMLGAVVATAMVLDDPQTFHTFVSEAYASGRGPDSTTEALRQVLFDGDQSSAGELGMFTSYLMTHNSKIGMLCFVLGVVFGIPVIYLLFQNGGVLGAFAGLYIDRGLGVELFSWLLPHGITEILAVLLCGAAGYYIGESVIFPGEYSRRANLARRGRTAGAVVVGAVGLFLLAGVIEGVFRQTVQAIDVRYTVAATTAVFWTVYLGVWGTLCARREGLR